MADFIAKFTPGALAQSELLKGLVLNVDGASNSKRAGVGIITTALKGSIIEKSFTPGYPAMNNEAEYEVDIAGLRMAMTLGITGLEVRCDSTLVICQVNGQHAAKDERMTAYPQLILVLKSKFPSGDFKRSQGPRTITLTPWPT